MKKIFTGILPALVTPFCEDNKTINTEAVRELIDLYLKQGANGFYILGGTGEGLVMAREEREIMCEAAVQYVNRRKPVIDHIAAMNLDEAVELAKHAERTGVDAIAAVPPSFFHYSEDDMYEYYKKLAVSVNIPLIIYYHPSAQKDMSARLIAHIFEIDNVTGVKWSSANFIEMMKLKEMTQGDMNIIIGPDNLLVSGFAAGGDAGIGSTYNVMLPEFVKIYDYFQRGQLEDALRVQMKINKAIDLLERCELIPAVKYAVGLMGIDVGTATFPMKQIGEEDGRFLENGLRELGWPF